MLDVISDQWRKPDLESIYIYITENIPFQISIFTQLPSAKLLVPAIHLHSSYNGFNSYFPSNFRIYQFLLLSYTKTAICHTIQQNCHIFPVIFVSVKADNWNFPALKSCKPYHFLHLCNPIYPYFPFISNL